MAKDPAFLFYSRDWYEGTRMMLPEERACYMDLMVYQHQHGIIPDDVKRLRLYCSGIDDDTIQRTLELKFTKTVNGWFNQRLTEEIAGRESYTQSKVITSCLAGLISSARIDKKTAAAIKKDFDFQSFKEIKDKEELKKMIKEWFNQRLTIYADANANADANINEDDKGGAGGSLEPVNPELMGFKGHARMWLEKNHGYVWGDGDDPAIEQIERKVTLMLAKPEHPYWTPPTDQKLLKFQEIIDHLDPWVKAKKFSLRYINEHFNEVKNGAKEPTGSNGHSHKRGVSLATKTVFRDGGEL